MATSEPADAIDTVLSRARSQIMLVDPGDGVDWAWSADLAPRVTEAAIRGCNVRVLFGRWPTAGLAQHFARRATEAGAEIRTGDTPANAMLTFDGTVALLPSDIHAIAVVTAPEVVRMLCGFADAAWSHATATPAVQRNDVDTAHRTLQQRIVALLADGAKDETIARALGMSVRTCRRHIADIMQRLDAVSRFQAGANAVRFGLTGNQPMTRQ
jgi:DNA-binding CsgD family transcriptional regulator